MDNKVKIALIDTGVNALHPYLSDHIAECYEVIFSKSDSSIVFLDPNTNHDCNGHGTACASVIKKECPNIDLYSFKVLNEDGICNLQMLETALSFIRGMDIKLINLSLSIQDKVDLTNLNKICNELICDGKILIASLNNHRTKSYPAILNNCIGVQGFILDTINSLWFNSWKKIQCVIDNTPFLHCNVEGTYSMFGKSNSYSTARLTGIISTILYNNNTFNKKQITAYLSGISERKYWTNLNLKKSKRFPVIDEYKGQIDQRIMLEIDDILKYHLHLDKKTQLDNQLLYSSNIGLTYEDCYSLIQKLEAVFGFTIRDYTCISRETFYSNNHLGYFVCQCLDKRM